MKRKRPSSLRLTSLSIGIAFALTPFASAQWSSSPFYTATVRGGFVAAGTSTRILSGPSTDPIRTLSVSGIPTGARILRAFADWSTQTNNPGNAAESEIAINGRLVMATESTSGDNLCWGNLFTASYFADVTNIITGNGDYQVTGATDENGALGEGISLVVVYEDTTMPAQTVDLFKGTIGGNVAGGSVRADFNLSSTYQGGAVHYFINALDGQDATDNFRINDALANGQFGLGVTDAWRGLISGPSSMYDHLDGNVQSFLTPGTNRILNQTDTVADCIGHSFGAISYTAVPEPGAVAGVTIGLLALTLRRRNRSA